MGSVYTQARALPLSPVKVRHNEVSDCFICYQLNQRFGGLSKVPVSQGLCPIPVADDGLRLQTLGDEHVEESGDGVHPVYRNYGLDEPRPGLLFYEIQEIADDLEYVLFQGNREAVLIRILIAQAIGRDFRGANLGTFR